MKQALVDGNTLLLPPSAVKHRNYFARKKLVSLTNGSHALRIPHGLDEAVLARNLGYDAPSPILTQYHWPRPPQWQVMDHQAQTAAFATLNRRLWILNDPGTGKTASVSWAVDYLASDDTIKNILILCPKSTTKQVWEKELFMVCPRRQVRVLDVQGKERRTALFRDDRANIHIANHHALTVDTLTKLFLSGERPYDLIILDETAAFRNAKNKVVKVLEQMLKKYNPRFWVLTGSPCPRAPTEVWALARLVNPSSVPKYFGQFRNMVMQPVNEYKWVPSPRGYELAYQAMQPAIRFRKDDCIDLPPMTSIDVYVELSDEQRKHYGDMKRKLKAETNVNGKAVQITAANAAVKAGKLIQIAAGVVHAGDGNVLALDFKPRLDVLMDLIDEEPQKTIVFAYHKPVVEYLAAKLEEAGYTTAVIHGGVSKAKRDVIFSAFQNDENPRVLVAHPACMAHGLTLTAAATIVWYSVATPENYKQASERINRPGQKHKMRLVHMFSTVEEKAWFAALKNSTSLEGAMLDLFNSGAIYNNEAPT